MISFTNSIWVAWCCLRFIFVTKSPRLAHIANIVAVAACQNDQNNLRQYGTQSTTNTLSSMFKTLDILPPPPISAVISFISSLFVINHVYSGQNFQNIVSDAFSALVSDRAHHYWQYFTDFSQFLVSLFLFATSYSTVVEIARSDIIHQRLDFVTTWITC